MEAGGQQRVGKCKYVLLDTIIICSSPRDVNAPVVKSPGISVIPAQVRQPYTSHLFDKHEELLQFKMHYECFTLRYRVTLDKLFPLTVLSAFSHLSLYVHTLPDRWAKKMTGSCLALNTTRDSISTYTYCKQSDCKLGAPRPVNKCIGHLSVTMKLMSVHVAKTSGR